MLTSSSISVTICFFLPGTQLHRFLKDLLFAFLTKGQTRHTVAIIVATLMKAIKLMSVHILLLITINSCPCIFKLDCSV